MVIDLTWRLWAFLLILIPEIITMFFCVDYIDEVFGDKSLWPSQPNPKAQSRILVTEFGDKVINIISYCSMQYTSFS